MRRWLVRALVAWAGATLSAASYNAGPWSVDVTLAADQPAIMLGEPTWLSFTVRNRSNEDLQIVVGGDYRNDLGRPDSFQVKTVRSDGQWISQPHVGLASGGLAGPKDLPAGGAYVFRLFVPHWATFKETGLHTISCRRTLQLLRPSAGRDFRELPMEEVVTDARTTLDVHVRDDARMGAVVAGLGEAMLRADGDRPGDEAVVALSWIDDPRVVPYFSRALAIRSYALKFIATQALAKFSTDEAFEGLKAAMRTQPSDFDYASGEPQPHLAAKIRAAAAWALSRSKHPRASDFLIAQRHDESENVRITILYTLGRMPPAQALPVLQEMTGDSSPRVRDAAKRYVSVLGGSPEVRGVNR